MVDIFDSNKHERETFNGNLKDEGDNKELELKKNTCNPLASFCYHPERVKFINEDPEEKIVLLLRKHPIVNLTWVILASVMLIAPSFLSVLAFFESLPGGFQVVFILIWYLLTLTFVFE
jgi:hypothetical protein